MVFKESLWVTGVVLVVLFHRCLLSSPCKKKTQSLFGVQSSRWVISYKREIYFAELAFFGHSLHFRIQTEELRLNSRDVCVRWISKFWVVLAKRIWIPLYHRYLMIQLSASTNDSCSSSRIRRFQCHKMLHLTVWSYYDLLQKDPIWILNSCCWNTRYE